MTAPQVLAPRSGLHLGYLDSLRGLSALYVAACHAYLMYAGDFAEAGLRSASGALLVGTSWVVFGRAAVAVFIVLSGYCLMLPIVQSPGKEWRVSFWPFMWRRAWRILPPYYGALACSAALIVLVPALGDPSIHEWHKSFPAFGTGSVVSHLLLLHNYFPAYQYAIDHPLWSIANLGGLDCHDYVLDWLQMTLMGKKLSRRHKRIAYIREHGDGPFGNCEWTPPIRRGQAYF